MARKPYLPQYKKTPISFGVAHLEEMPEIAQKVGECVMLWSHIELQMALLLSALMGANVEPATAVFLALKNARAQREVLVAAAEVKLTGGALDAFTALMAVYKSLEGQRADIAHGIFSASAAIPDGSIWIASRDCATASLDIIAQIDRTHGQDVSLHPLQEKAFYYKPQDIAELYANMRELWQAAFNLWAWIRTPGIPIAVQLFHQLCGLPQIRRELDKIQSARTTQEALVGSPRPEPAG